MNQGISVYSPRAWSEAQERAETYLRALRGSLGPAECELLAAALCAARAQERSRATTHPVTLVMEALFDLLPAEEAPLPMTPPIQRVRMLPEKTEFPFHEGLRRLFRTQLLPFAGAR